MTATTVREIYGEQFGRLLQLAPGSKLQPRLHLARWASQLERMKSLAKSPTRAAEVSNPAALALLRGSRRQILWKVLGAVHQERVALSGRARDYLRVLETTPDLLGPLGATRQEILHSQAIAWFLDVQRSGEVGRRCLAAFSTLVEDLEQGSSRGDIPERFEVGDLPSVATEVYVGSNERVDIVLQSARGIAFIEVKVDAEEGVRQLDRYGESLLAVTGADKNRWLIFLTADPSAETATKYPHRHLSFGDLLRAWMPIAAEQTTPGHQFLRLYLKSVARHLLGIVDGDDFDRWSLARKWSAIRFVQTLAEDAR